ncbi:MAG: winged helix DNA-binding protein [Sphingomonas sp.]|nr:winged helix DNA-binding protein [Sphingomonas sp.]
MVDKRLPVEEAQVDAFMAGVTGLLRRFKLEPGLLADSVYADLHHNDVGLLTHLKRGEGQPVRILAAELGAPDSTISSALDRLARRGLIQRIPSETDRRSVLVSLSPDGAALVDRLLQIQRDNCRAMLASLPPGDRETLILLAGTMLGTPRS